MTPTQLLLAQLPDAKRNGNGWQARCPAHDDRQPSLSIAQGDDGRALVNCHAGCQAAAIVDAIGLTMADLMPDTSAPNGRTAKRPAIKDTPAKVYSDAQQAIEALEQKLGKHSAQWTYDDAHGQPVRVVLRWDLQDGGKTIRPVIRTTGGWCTSGATAPADGWELYHMQDLLKRPCERVYVCEGEKACEAAHAVGLLATTSPQGSKSASKANWMTLAGADVVILPDNDTAGLGYADEVAGLLLKLSPQPTVRIVALPGLEDIKGGDMADYVELRSKAGVSHEAIKAEVETLADQATPKQRPMVGGEPKLICMNDVEPAEIAWLWPGRIAMGRITLMVGRPGDGKSFVTAYMAANVSLGGVWPDGSTCPKGSVILCSAEDDPADTIAPRLMAHGADRTRIHCLSGVMMTPDDKGHAVERVFTLADLDALRQTLQQVKDCRLIVIDPIGSYLGANADAHRDNEVRGVLAPACKLAAEFGVAMLVVAHTRKSAAPNADDMAMGSRAFTGLARCVLHLMVDPEDQSKQRRLLLPGKNNLSEKAAGLAFDIGPGLIEDLPRINWHEGEVDITADEAVNREPAGDDDQQSARAEAKAFLLKALDAGPRAAKEVEDEAKNGEGISPTTLKRARKQLGIEAYRPENPGAWWWRMPTVIEQAATSQK